MFQEREKRRKDKKATSHPEDEFEHSDLEEDKDGLSDDEYGDKPKKKL